MAGKKLAELGFTEERIPDHVAVKESVFPFVRFPGVDTLLGPEMKSTGEVMGLDTNLRGGFRQGGTGSLDRSAGARAGLSSASAMPTSRDLRRLCGDSPRWALS